MKVEIDVQTLSNLLRELPNEQIVGLFWYAFGFCQGKEEPAFFNAIIAGLVELRKGAK